MGTKFYYLQVKHLKKNPLGEFVQDEDTRVCSGADFFSDVRKRDSTRPSNSKLSKIEDYD